MLQELSVRDFAIIDQARIALGPGLNVLTGETGAGKSILVDAVALLLGERADPTMVRSGADRAVIQGVFEVDTAPGVVALLQELGVPLEPGEPLIVDREVHAAGRSLARLNGHTVPVRELARLASTLVDLHSQADTASLRRESQHLDLLDRYAGLAAERAEFAGLVGDLRAIDDELASLVSDEAALARRADVLAFQIEEIGSAALLEGEDEVLLAERLRLANSERLVRLANQAYEDLHGTADDSGALDAAESANAALAELTAIDPSLGAVHETVSSAAIGLAEAARALLAYRDAADLDPARLDEVEGRLAAIADLKRKYGGTVAAILAWAARAVVEYDGLEHAAERVEALQARRAGLLTQLAPRAATLSVHRQAAAARLSRAVADELAELGLPDAEFAVNFARVADEAGLDLKINRVAFDRTGVDRVRFDISLNPGEPPRPLAKIASGGETARLMLALKAVLGASDAVPTLIFDEIDAGIGGRLGATVGRKLWAAASTHQVLCVTHLPQVAAYADAHYHVRKNVEGDRTVTRVDCLAEAERPDELRQMLGTATDAGLLSARELLDGAAAWKQGGAAAKHEVAAAKSDVAAG